MKTEMFAQKQPADYPKTRVIENRHGLYLRARISGTFGFFNVVYLLIMLTTSLTLLAGAAKLVDFVALYCSKEKDAYYAAKFQVTRFDSDSRDGKASRPGTDAAAGGAARK